MRISCSRNKEDNCEDLILFKLEKKTSSTSLIWPAIKIFWKIRLGSKLSLGLIYGLSFRIQAASYFPQSWVQKTGLIFYLADFYARNWRIPGFIRTRLNIEPYSTLKPTKVGFLIYFHWASLLKSSRRFWSCQSCDTIACQSCVQDWVLKSGLRNNNSNSYHCIKLQLCSHNHEFS